MPRAKEIFPRAVGSSALLWGVEKLPVIESMLVRDPFPLENQLSRIWIVQQIMWLVLHTMAIGVTRTITMPTRSHI